MKKLVVFMMLVVATFFISCGSKSNFDVIEEKSNEVVSNKSEESNKSKETNEEESYESEKEEKELKEEKESEIQDYLDKYFQLEKELKDSLEVKYSGTTIDMREAASIEHINWDDLLNEIYGVLQEQLLEEDMAKLKEEQISWLAIRDSKAEESTIEVKGGTIEPLVYVMSLGQSTKERCYELIINYMK